MSGPLASLKVLDFSTLLPGPFASLMLADMGAEVVSLTKWQILSQSGTSALTNANQASQTVLGLLR